MFTLRFPSFPHWEGSGRPEPGASTGASGTLSAPGTGAINTQPDRRGISSCRRPALPYFSLTMTRPRGLRPGAAEVNISFAAFYENQRRSVLGRLLRRVRRFEDAEDLTELAFVKALAAWDQCPYPVPNRRPWLLRIARNVTIDYQRAHAQSHTMRLPDEFDVISQDDPSRDAESAAIRASYAEALERLTPRQRQIVTRFFAGFTSGDVARQLGLSEGAIKSTVHRARQILRQDPMLAQWTA